MTLVPRLPETAPFPPAQRARLDGFVAGLFGGVDDPPDAAPTEDELPWHDPTLALDERLALVAGRRPEHRLMAAMAQLDCGQCGYLCESYAAAIASGAETSWSRCVPGGKATSRALKELFAETTNPGGTKVPAAAVAPVRPSPLPADDAAEPFTIQLREAASLHRAGAEKDTRHVVLKTIDRPAHYQVGDSLAVVARNGSDLVAAIIQRLAVQADTLVQSPDGEARRADCAPLAGKSTLNRLELSPDPPALAHGAHPLARRFRALPARRRWRGARPTRWISCSGWRRTVGWSRRSRPNWPKRPSWDARAAKRRAASRTSSGSRATAGAARAAASPRRSGCPDRSPGRAKRTRASRSPRCRTKHEARHLYEKLYCVPVAEEGTDATGLE